MRRAPIQVAQKHASGARLASLLLGRAIRAGEMHPAKAFKCFDCGNPAECYDHRDYDKPLVVDPVCVGCNARRGSAKPKDWTFEEMLESFYGLRAAWAKNKKWQKGRGLVVELRRAYDHVYTPPSWARRVRFGVSKVPA